MNIFFLLLVLLFGIFLFPSSVLAVCPVCTIAVGAGLGISRWIGIDDVVTGIWIGGLILSSGLWLSDWINKKGWNIKYRNFVSVFLMFVFVIPPLYWSGLVGVPGNSFLGIDKILFGAGVGSLIFLFSVWLDKWLRAKNQGKVYVYYQKVIIPVFLLTFASFLFYLLTL